MKINKFKFLAILVLAVSSFAICSGQATAKKKLSYEDQKAVDHIMRMLQMDTENLHIAFDKKNWTKMEFLAQKIHDGCAGLEKRGDVDVPPEFDDFGILSGNLHDYAEELIAASKRKDIEEAKLAYKRMEKTCVKCHNIFRN